MNLEEEPYNLKEDEVIWIEKTLENMSIGAKVGQMLIIHGFKVPNTKFESVVRRIKPGGIILKKGTRENLSKLSGAARKSSDVNPLICGSFQNGPMDMVKDSIDFGNALQVSACKEKELSRKIGMYTGEAVSELGINANFAPNVDSNYNWRADIKSTDTYGAYPKKIADNSIEFMKGAREKNILSIMRQFPGNGVAERDYRIISTANTLTRKEWDENYGYVYEELIKAGVLSCLVGNISIPYVVKKNNEDDPDWEETNENKYDYKLPASLSKETLQGILRGELGFKGLIISDTTTLTGFSSDKSREEILPQAIKAGCDMIICSKDYIKDYIYILQGVKNGTINMERINESVRRILGVKAALGMHLTKRRDSGNKKESSNIGYDIRQHIDLSYEIADKGITLLKDHQKLLPLKEEHKKILLVTANRDGKSGEKAIQTFKRLLEHRGCKIEIRNAGNVQETILSFGENMEEFKKKFDLIIYLFNLKNGSIHSLFKIESLPTIALKAPMFIEEVPSIFISLGNPYHSFEVPMFKTFINAYSDNTYTIENLCKKMFGEKEFKGTSPVYCVFDYYGDQVTTEGSKLFKPQ